MSGPLSDFIKPRGEKVSPSDFPDMPFIGMDHVEAHTTKIVGHVPSRQMKSSASRFYQNDVLYGRLRPYLNKVAQPRFDGLASGEFIVFEGNARMEPSFLRYRLHARDFVSFASHLNEGDRPRVNFKQIGTFRVLLPPRTEQRRIVEKIEALFDEIDRGVESLRAAKRGIEQYRQSLLKAAFEGRLTADWRVENSEEVTSTETLIGIVQKEHETRQRAALQDWERKIVDWKVGNKASKKPRKPKVLANFDAASLSKENDRRVPFGWLWLSLSTLGEVGGGITKNQKRNALPLKAMYLRVANVYSNCVDLDEVKEIGVTAEELRNTRLAYGDLLFVEGNGSIEQIGRVAMWNASILNMTHQNHLIRYRTNGILSPIYALYFLMSPVGRNHITAQASSTSGLHTLSMSKVGNLRIPVCCPAEQLEIVRILNTRLDGANRLEAEIDNNLACADALRQSVLKRAFSGNLVPQDPDDEPASILLKRTRTENAPKPRKRSNGKRKVAHS